LSSKAIEKERDPVGLPDFTLPVAIVAQIIASLKVDIAAQSIGNIKVDIAAQSIESLNVNIASQSVTLDINIKSSSISVPVDIVAQSITLDVNIASATAIINVNVTNAVININFGSQTTGVKTEDIWSAEIGYNRVVNGSAYIDSGSFEDVIIYTVPYGEKLYISVVSGTSEMSSRKFCVLLYNYTLDIWYWFECSDTAIHMHFSPPIVVPGGHTILIRIYNYDSAPDEFRATLLAWKK